MKDIRLPDTSLCAIVRDEAMNPAGGIIDFVVKHFYASLSGTHNKWEYWYSRVIDNPKLLCIPPPSEQPKFNLWKQYNLRRELYR